jgi:electron transfer flavoprotein alpha subunit
MSARLVAQVQVEGVDEIVSVDAGLAHFDADVYVAVLSRLVQQRSPVALVAGQTANSISWAPQLAVRCGLGYANDVVALSVDGDQPVVTREPYSGKVQTEVVFPSCLTAMVLVRGSVWPAARDEGRAPVTAMSMPEAATCVRAAHVRYEESTWDDLDLSKAPAIISIGRGIGEKENLAIFHELADAVGAALASSRPLVDAGWMPSSRQVGQSGSVVSPGVYLAFGISGSAEHVAGMKQSGVIIAVNTDARAPIFNVAHFGAVADALEVAEEMGKLL